MSVKIALSYISWFDNENVCIFIYCAMRRPLLVSWQKRWRLWRWRAVYKEVQPRLRRTGRTGGRRSWTRWRCWSCRTTCSRRSRRSRTSPRSWARSAQSLRPVESKFNHLIIVLFTVFASIIIRAIKSSCRSGSIACQAKPLLMSSQVIADAFHRLLAKLGKKNFLIIIIPLTPRP